MSTTSSKSQVAIIMGSDSDWRVMKKAQEVLGRFEVSALSRVVSAHRTPEDLPKFALEAESQGIQVIIAGAGGGCPSSGNDGVVYPASRDWSADQRNGTEWA